MRATPTTAKGLGSWPRSASAVERRVELPGREVPGRAEHDECGRWCERGDVAGWSHILDPLVGRAGSYGGWIGKPSTSTRRGAAEWAQRRLLCARSDPSDVLARIEPGAVRIDLGCGPGRYTAELGRPVVALDAAIAMLELARVAAPAAWCVQADLEALPIRPFSLGGAWAQASYLHVPKPRLPLALAQLHRATTPGAPLAIAMRRGDYSGHALPGDTFTGRFFASWQQEPLVAVVEGAGFSVDSCSTEDEWIHLRGTRLRTLPDVVGPDLRILMCGLNPSLRSADAGLGFAGPSNRFWSAAIEAGVVTVRA